MYALKFRFNYHRQCPCITTLQYMGPDGGARSNKYVTEDFYLDLLSKSQISQKLGSARKKLWQNQMPRFPIIRMQSSLVAKLVRSWGQKQSFWGLPTLYPPNYQ